VDRGRNGSYPSPTVGNQLAKISVGALLTCLGLALGAAPASAQNRVLELSYTPTARAQIAIWVETGEGTYLRTFRLTDAVARRGIGNRPGALQMNSGYHWPYGRREGVLPIWGHRRLEGEGEPFRRVIFQDRASEGFASRTTADASEDDFYCLSFNRDFSSKETLEGIDPTVDAMACPTVFNSDKGRYLTEGDVVGGYAEPFEDEMGVTSDMRVMDLTSLYPARRDLDQWGADDHPDSRLFLDETRTAMPEIDAVTMATPAGERLHRLQLALPAGWEPGEYVLYVEVNVEGDYNGAQWGPERFPTPTGPRWDTWAENYGYPYRGQPAVLYAVPFTLNSQGGVYTARDPMGYGEIHGMDGEVRPLDATISNDPVGAPGSGADRLLLQGDDTRLTLRVVPSNVCDGPEPPDACFQECSIDADCGMEGFLCYQNECLDECNDQVAAAPMPVADLQVTPMERSWEQATVEFTAPSSTREIFEYQVRVARTPYDPSTPFDEWGVEAKVAAAAEERVVIDPHAALPGETVSVDVGHLERESTYYVGIRAVDSCSAAGEVVVAEHQTTAVKFTTVSPCFVATATYGTPMAEEIGVLRRFRDRYLMSNGAGRALVEAYYDVGPAAADEIREDDGLRAVSRAILEPIVAFARWVVED